MTIITSYIFSANVVSVKLHRNELFVSGTSDLLQGGVAENSTAHRMKKPIRLHMVQS